MSTLAMHSPPRPYYPRYHGELTWEDARTELPPARERIALPSIRQAFPELKLQLQDTSANTPPSATFSNGGYSAGSITPPEYVHSPSYQKRRRLSAEYERDIERTHQIPRRYNGPHEATSSRQQSPLRTAVESWGSSSRTSPHGGHGALPFIQSRGAMEPIERVEPRPTLPSLALLGYERGVGETHRFRTLPCDEYAQETMRRPSIASSHSHGTEGGSPIYRTVHGYPSSHSHDVDGGSAYRAGNGWGLHHPTRMQSLSVGSVHPFEKTPFSPAAYGHQYQDSLLRINEYGIGANGDNKQRKRRGNLPKETTDKLRAWFVGHLHHPYPSEDEKQELVRQTGLQMNQISNWFINARRRQLPTMINNARAESDAMIVRGEGGSVLPSTERIDYESESKPLSDSEDNNYSEVTVEPYKRRRTTNTSRGSI